MKIVFSIILKLSIAIMITVGDMNAQNTINLLRYNDNFSHIKNASLKNGFDRLKYAKIGEKTFLSIGGEVREQFQLFNNINFGDLPPKFSSIKTHQLNHRMMIHANIDLGKHFRFFTQMNSTLQFLNVNPPAPEIDVNQLSLHQAFAEIKFDNWRIRIGRQELFYGNHRILTVREGPNTRQAFDGLVVKNVFKHGTIDFLAISKAISKRSVFDDEHLKEEMFGIYGNVMLSENIIGLDFYGLNFQSDQRKYNHQAGSENRQTLGLRLFSNLKRINFEIEGAYQSGKFNALTIDAYSAFVDLNVVVVPEKKGIIGLAANIASGDKDSYDKKLNTYNLLYAKPAFGLAIPIGSTNIISLYPYLKINPIPKLNVLVQVFFLSRNNVQDGLYSPLMTMVRPPSETTSTMKSLGTFFVLETTYQQSKNISFSFDASYFKVGSSLKATGKGKDLSYVSFKSTLKF